MKHNIFLLKNILDPDFIQSLSVQEKQEVDDYLHQMKVGPADGNMDGEWQTDGLGYYKHLHVLEKLNAKEKYDYQMAMLEDSSAWLNLYPEHTMIKTTLYALKIVPPE